MADEGKKKYTSAEMQKWLFEKAAEAKDPKIARKIVMSNDERGRAFAMLGKLYLFKYNPIGRYTLSKYDKLPLCVPIERYGNGFLGLNLHYLGVAQRSALLELLLQTRSEEIVNDKTVMKVNYQKLLTNTRVEKLAIPCVHRYVFTQVRSKFIEIYPSEYDLAVQLPVEDWVFNR
jgi:hypothetical protein